MGETHSNTVELILVRHAKSDWGDPGLADHDRPLNGRGTRNAPMMAQRARDAGIAPQRILSSTAVRARTTAEWFAEELNAELELDGELYLASADTLLAKAAASGSGSGPGSAPTSTPVMIVAHDPGLSDLAWRLSGGAIEHIPTCAVARFTWREAGWAAAARRAADFWTLDTPR